MAPRTVQQIFGLKPEEVNALTVLSGLEGFRGGAQSPDVAAVAANVLSRRLQGGWGGRDIRNIAKSPGQYEAVFGYNMQQLADPAFGARVLGGQEEFNRLRNIVNDPSLVGEQFRRSRGAQSFRGVSLYENKKPGDYTPVPGKSNFYFNPLDASTYKKGLRLFGDTAQPQVVSQPSDQRSVEDILSSTLGRNEKAQSFLNKFALSLMGALLPSVTPTNTPSPLLNPFNMLGLP